MPRKPGTRPPYIMVADTTWALARADYLGGMTAQQVADKHGIGLHNLRQTMARKGWTKRALAEAHAAPGPGGPPAAVSPPTAAAADPAAGRGDLLDTVLARARAALTAGRGAEATALLKAMREYVLVHQDVEDVRHENRAAFEEWDRTRPDQAGALDEPVTLQSLYGRWCGLSDAEQVRRLDPQDETGVLAALDQLAPGWREVGKRKR